MPASGPFNCLPQTHLSIQASAAWLDDYTGTAETLFKATDHAGVHSKVL